MIDAERVQDRRLQIVDGHRIGHDVVAEVVGLAQHDAALHAAAGHPHAEVSRMMIAPVVHVGQLALAEDRPPELSTPHDQRVVEQAALLQVRDERRRRLIRALALQRQIARQILVLIPAAVIELDEADVALRQPPRQQTVGRVGARLPRFRTVHLEDGVG